ncbi:MAG: hypothetical protein AAGC68_12830 [Verrucomicrobiota bacterium]
MKGRVLIVLLVISVLASGQEENEEAAPAMVTLATLDVPNSKDGAYPGGSTPISGKWAVDAGAKKLKLAPEPLAQGWLEFGPEVPEKGATIAGLARAPGEGRLRSRFGIGLYGKNGFQLRIDQGKGVVELVRRGLVLKKVDFAVRTGDLYEMELTVQPDEEDWKLIGRAWEYETDRPVEPLFEFAFDAEDLLFPLAGRGVILGTPFSGEPVQFAIAKMYGEGYEEAVLVEGDRLDPGGDGDIQRGLPVKTSATSADE